MKAAICHEFGKPLVIEEIVIDVPQAGELKVKLSACAICHSDIHYMEGAWGGTLPAVYGHEAAGVVEEVGDGVTTVAPGDHVIVSLLRSCGQCHFCKRHETYMCEAKFALDSETRLHTKDGKPIFQGLRTSAFAEAVVVEQSQVVPIPADVRFDSASLLACGVITGLGVVVNTAKVELGSSVLIIGTGGVGLNSVQGAVRSGADPIIAVDLSDTKLEAATAFGATHTINSLKQDLWQGVKDITGGYGADYVFITVGSREAIEQGIGLMRRAGTVVIVGMPPTGARVVFEPADIAEDGLRILGSKMGSTQLQTDVPKLIDLYINGELKLDELITNRYPLDEINEAIASVHRAEALRNVIIF